jgi:hypothetical protein
MAASASVAAIEERAIDGNWGQIFMNGHVQADLKGITGTVAIAQQALPRSGSNTQVYRRGRITRSGSVSLLKVDSRFESWMLKYANMTAQEMREARGKGEPVFQDLELLVKLADPESWGSEELMLFGIKFWELPIGFTQNTMLERDLPMTWNTEHLVEGIARPGNLYGASPEGEFTYPAAGEDADPVLPLPGEFS